ncbi:DUF58 domain-containing protein [Microbacterium album]|uniref:DUF58 domain-containing protein n=1 Tax=Microbacterium album TaxID=2053191 RepID=A0A917MLF3_9MICO|nr:DUF58 domain-containing protein [Microbacterium album]GGH42264.1 hypothetical protein GCM10010921_15390 [Microbacterium album]
MSRTAPAARRAPVTPRHVLAAAERALRIGSRLGWAVVAVAVVAAVVAGALGWAEFLAIAVTGGAAIVLAVAFVIGRAVYRVDVDLASARVVVGEQAVGRLRVRNIARRASPATRIELPVGRGTAHFRVSRLAPDQEQEELFTIPTARRAVLTVGPVTSVRTDPLGLLRREVTWTRPRDLYVHPRTVALANDTIGLLRDLEGLETRELANDDVSFHALREYAPGDDLRHVHWKSTARTQTMMIRQFEQTRRSHLVVALSTSAAEYAGEDEFELAVSATGSIGVGALRDGTTLSMLAAGAELPSPTRSRLLDGLSGIEQSGAGIDAVARSVATLAATASVVVLVTGSGASLADVRGAALRVPPTARTVCVRAADGGELRRRMIGDVVTVDVPELSALRAAMRAVAS